MPESLKPVPEWLRRELSALDGRLAVRWNPKLCRWQVMRKREHAVPPSSLTKKDVFERDWWQYVSCFTWEEPNGDYRELDARLIHALRKGDVQTRDFRVIIAEMEAEEAALRREKQWKVNDFQENMLGDMRDAAVGRCYSGAHASGGVTL